ncbi:dnaJ [Symbiodinium sp. CCMP2592]|nr:dnaJ [Symbiodinium sp. CCMP2592]
MSLAFPSDLWGACAAACATRGGFVLQGAPEHDLNRYFAVRHLGATWCFQSLSRIGESKSVEILTTDSQESDNSYDFCLRAHHTALGRCQERKELLDPRSFTFGGRWVEAELPDSVTVTTLGWTLLLVFAALLESDEGDLGLVHEWDEKNEVVRFPNALGRFRDSGLDYHGAVLYVHAGEAMDIWPPLFLRHYSKTKEWCVEMGWCYSEGCFESAGPVGPCKSVQDGCRQGVEVMCLREDRWQIKDWIQTYPDLAHGVEKYHTGDFPAALSVLPGVHQTQAGLARLYLLLGDFRGWDTPRMRAIELPATETPTKGQRDTRLRNRHVVVVRVPKASSSSLASLFVRIGRTLGHLVPTGAGEKALRRRLSKRRVMLASRHVLPRVAWDVWRATLPEFLAVASVRHPFKRCLSSFYYESYTEASPPSTDDKLAWLQSSCDSNRFTEFTTCCSNFQYEFLSLWSNQTISDLISRYHFLFVTERMEDSLLAFRAQWNLTFNTMLHVRVKSSSKRQVCNFLDKWDGYAPKRAEQRQEPPEVMEFGQSAAFEKSNWADFAIWRAANARLDTALAAMDPLVLARDRESLRAVLSMAKMCEDVSTLRCTDCLHEDTAALGEGLAEDGCQWQFLGSTELTAFFALAARPNEEGRRPGWIAAAPLPDSHLDAFARLSVAELRANEPEPAEEFDVLGLSQDCDDEEIKPAFRRLARQLHPDVETGSEARFKRLVWASRELASAAGRKKWRARGSGEAMSLEEYELENEDFAFDLNDWPFEELDDLLRVSEEAVDTETMTDVRSSWCDDGFAIEDLR